MMISKCIVEPELVAFLLLVIYQLKVGEWDPQRTGGIQEPLPAVHPLPRAGTYV